MLTFDRTKQRVIKAVPGGRLSTMDIFKGLPPEVLRDLESRMVEKKYSKSDPIIREGEPAERVWFVKEGHVKAGVTASDGRCQTLCMIGPGKMFGSCCCFGGGTVPCQAVAETEVTVISFPRTFFTSLMVRYPQLGSGIVAEVSQRLRDAKGSQVFEQESVERRILHALASLVPEFGITLPLTKREIAEMVGTTVESSIRTFSRLEEAGLVSGSRGKIVIKNLPGLRERLDKVS